MAASDAPPTPATINRLRSQVAPSMAMLAGMRLELFTPWGTAP